MFSSEYVSPEGLECLGTHNIPKISPSLLRASLNASKSIPSFVRGIGTTSIPKSLSIIKCLSKPGTGHMNLGFFKSFQGIGSANKKLANIV